MSDHIELHTAESFGNDYLREFNRVLDRHLALRTGNVLEWGAGYTTYEILKRLDVLGCRLFVTVDENPDYLREILRRVKPRPWFRAVAQDLAGPRSSQTDPETAYSTRPLLLDCQFDFILIDGRRRMECAFVASLLAHEETVVVLHDYRRGRYQPILALFDVVEDGPQFRVMRARPGLLALVRERARAIIDDIRRQNDWQATAFFDFDGCTPDQTGCI